MIGHGVAPTEPRPTFGQLKLVVADLDASLTFYRRLGLDPQVAPGARHASAALTDGVVIEWDAAEIVPSWDSGWQGSSGGSTVLVFCVDVPVDVDRLHDELVAAGYAAHQPPYDAFFGRRCAIVDDPDGNPVAVMGPMVSAKRFWPPQQPPEAG